MGVDILLLVLLDFLTTWRAGTQQLCTTAVAISSKTKIQANSRVSSLFRGMPITTSCKDLSM